MADWTQPFRASYRYMRVSRATGLETERLDGILDDGTIERNDDTSCKESATVTAVDWRGIGPDLVRVYLDAEFDDGSTGSAALGTFLPSTSSRTVGGAARTSTVQLTGRLAELDEDMFGQAFQLPAGTDAVGYAAQICRAAGFSVIADDSPYVLPEAVAYGIGAPSSSGSAVEGKLAVVNDLLDRAGFSSARTDALGRIVMRRYAEPQDRAPSASFIEGADARFLREVEDGRDVSGVANAVYAVYSAPESDDGERAAGVVGSAEDASGGEFSIASVGRRIVRRESYSEEATQEEADAKAAELLRTSQAVKRTVSISHVYAPLTIGDSFDLTYRSQGLTGRYAVRTQRITLGAGCLTETEGRAYER